MSNKRTRDIGTSSATIDGHKKPKAAPEAVNAYAGYCLPRDGEPIQRRAVSSLTPAQFFAEFVGTRKPVVLTGAANLDPAWHGSARWNNEYLQKVAGDATVRVERRAAASEAYGRGQNVRMKFGELLQLLASGDARHYMTTQDLEVDDEGRPALMSAPCTELYAAGDFPLIPALLGSLLPMNYNMWLGNTVSSEGGSSSGLHHDFHDNLYVLLRGRKRFRLFSPAHAPALYTIGKVSQVHPNGRICYEGAPANADGSDPDAVAAMRADMQRESAECDLKAAEAAVAAGETGATDRLRAAEDALEAAIEAGLDAELGIDNTGKDEDELGDDDEAVKMWGADWNGEEDLDDDGDDDEEEESDDAEQQLYNDDEPTAKSEATPNNFCQIDLDEENWREKWPLAKGAVMTEVSIEAGEMLWLPAGWFHEVTSMAIADSVGGVSDTEKLGHLAFNYWFHPPDSDAFERPYSSTFWQWDWDQRQGTPSRDGQPSVGAVK